MLSTDLDELQTQSAWSVLAGRICEETVNYWLYSQAEEDAAMKRHPKAEEVDVYAGLCFCTGKPSQLGVQNRCPCELAIVEDNEDASEHEGRQVAAHRR